MVVRLFYSSIYTAAKAGVGVLPAIFINDSIIECVLSIHIEVSSDSSRSFLRAGRSYLK